MLLVTSTGVTSTCLFIIIIFNATLPNEFQKMQSDSNISYLLMDRMKKESDGA